jgi:hypothetical protein
VHDSEAEKFRRAGEDARNLMVKHISQLMEFRSSETDPSFKDENTAFT